MSLRLGITLLVCWLVAPEIHATPIHSWSHIYGDYDTETLAAMAVDADGNILLCGTFFGTLNLNAITLTSAGESDIFVGKLAPDGSTLWSRRIGFTFEDVGVDVTADAVGNVIVVGKSEQPFVIRMVKYSPDGTQQWIKQLGLVQSIHEPYAVDTNSAKEIIVTGRYNGRFFGSDPDSIVYSDGYDLFAARLDPTGNVIWGKSIQTSDNTSARHLAVDDLGQIVMAGEFTESLDFGNGTHTAAGLSDVFIAKFNSGGASLWSDSYGSTAIEDAASFSLSRSGRIALGANLYAAVDFGGGPLTPSVAPEPCIAVFDPSGAHVWSRSMVSSAYGLGLSMEFAENSDLLFSCYGQGSIDFGGGPVAGSGSWYNTYVARFLQNTGQHRWSAAFAGDGNVSGFVAESRRGLILAGNTEDQVDFGGGMLVFAGEVDFFAVRFADVLTAAPAPPLIGSLEQNVPNPFNPSTVIPYTLGSASRVVITVYNAAGRTVRHLDEGAQAAGAHSAVWNGRDDEGHGVASGVYFYRLEGAPGAAARKMVLLK